MSSTNPFDDTSEERGSDYRRGVATVTSPNKKKNPPSKSMNPFDDDYADDVVVQGGISKIHPRTSAAVGSKFSNPFDDDFIGGDNDDSQMMMNTHTDDNDDPPVEASWQYLGDLPYRTVPVYPYVKWNSSSSSRRETNAAGAMTNPNENGEDQDQHEQDDILSSINNGLAAFPPQYLRKQHRSTMLDARDVRELLSTTTTTKVAGCAHGGPIAAMTLPLSAGGSSGSSSSSSGASMTTTELRIMTNAGKSLANIEFPPRGLQPGSITTSSSSSSSSSSNAGQPPPPSRIYTASDVLTIGFTDRTVLIVVMRDSLCVTYDLSGKMILPPFHILPSGVGDVGMPLMEACVYEGGVAVLSASMHCALVELLDQHDDPSYVDGANLASRKVLPLNRSHSDNSRTSGGGTTTSSSASASSDSALPAHYALVTPLQTADFAGERYCSFVTLAVLSRFHTSSRHPEVFLSTSDNSVVVVDTVTLEMADVDCRSQLESPIVFMNFAPNGRFLACFTQASILTVISTSFETKVLDFDTSDGSSASPSEMKWCGEDSVVLHWKNLGILMVGPYGDWLRFPYDHSDNVYIIPEIDSCRVVTDTSVEILQRVPPATALLLRIGSIEPAAMLLDAADAFESGSPASDEAARAIIRTGMLMEAIETCIDASVREFDIPLQKRLLRAASYGLHFSYKDPNELENIMMGGPITPREVRGETEDDHHGADGNLMPSPIAAKFVEAAKKIRILNSLRHPAVGFILTASQFDSITPTGVVARLIAMKRPALATSIGKYLMLPKSVQLLARASKASALVSSADSKRSDSEIADAAIKIIKNEGKRGGGGPHQQQQTQEFNRGGYASVALAANQAGRPGVATLLLMLETSVVDKVQALISIGSYADAVAVATNARDGDFVFQALMEYEKSCTSQMMQQQRLNTNFQQNFIHTVITKFTHEAFHSLRRYLMTLSDVQGVKELLRTANKNSDAGLALAKKALECKPNERERKARLLNDASGIFGQSKETAFHKQCTDDYFELIRDQEVLRNKYGNKDVAPECSSVTSTMVSLIHHAALDPQNSDRLLNDTEKLAKKFRIPDKRMWHVKIKALSESGQWPVLKALAGSRAKSPIGYKPFARAAIKGKRDAQEIIRYIERITQPEEKYDLYCEAHLWNRALDEAAKMRDFRRVANVRSLCNSAEIEARCDSMLQSGGV